MGICMLKKSLVQGLFICLITVFPVNAATVSFLVIETGLPRESPSSQHSAMWENGLMDVFFESGHIVSNAPILRVIRTPGSGFPDEAERDYDEAEEGGMDYFVVAIVSHPIPCNVTLRLFKIGSQQVLFEHKYTGKTYRTSKEEYDAVKSEIRVLAARVK